MQKVVRNQGGLAPVGGEAREVGRVTGQIRGGRFEVPALSDCAYTESLPLFTCPLFCGMPPSFLSVTFAINSNIACLVVQPHVAVKSMRRSLFGLGVIWMHCYSPKLLGLKN